MKEVVRGLFLFVLGAAVGSAVGAVIGVIMWKFGVYSSIVGALYAAGFMGGLFAVKFEEHWFAARATARNPK